jgi:YidC/Oxa1 family membrane protein insertase
VSSSPTAGTFFRCWRQYRAFRRLPRRERRIVFYAESGQDWHHWRDVIRYLTGELGETICYVSSDPTDPGLHQGSPRIRPFCIGRGLWRIWFFQFLAGDVLVTQLLDLENFDLRRSIHPVHYVYVFHSLISTHMADHADSFDHYDTILCAGPHQMREIRKREELHGLRPKQLIPHGYARLDDLLASRPESPDPRDGIHVLVAPSWGEQTILPICGLALTGILLDAGFRVTLRPHYQTRWMMPEVIDRIIDRYRSHRHFAVVEQMGESKSLFASHVMITDWSGAGQDFGLGLEKPVLFIDVPPKARNDTWPELGIEPFESYVRDKIGAILPLERVHEAPDVIRKLVRDPVWFRQHARALRNECIFNVGNSGAAGGESIARVAREIASAGPGRGGQRGGTTGAGAGRVADRS